MWTRLRRLMSGLYPTDDSIEKGPTDPLTDTDGGTLTFDEHYANLVTSMSELVKLLDEVGEDFWRDWIQEDLKKIEEGDRYALDHFLSAYGGMGSFNDLIFSARLDSLRTEAWVSAKAMKRELDRS